MVIKSLQSIEKQKTKEGEKLHTLYVVMIMQRTSIN